MAFDTMMRGKTLEKDIQHFAERFPFKQEIKGKTFLITGGTGLLGSIFIACLRAVNQQESLHLRILAPVRNEEKARNLWGESNNFLFWKKTNLESIGAKDFDEKIDYIIHFAAPTASKFFVEHPVETLTTMFNATNALLALAKEKKSEQFVYISSLESYGAIMNPEGLITEEQQGYINPLSPRSSYSMGKRIAECACIAYCHEHKVPVKIARLTQTFGAGISKEDQRVFAQFAESIIRKEDITLHTDGKSAKPYCYTIDAILGILYILLKGENGAAYNVANEQSYISIKDMAEFLIKEFGVEGTKVKIEMQEGMGYAPTTMLPLSDRKLRNLGWQPDYDLKKMFQCLISYLKENEKS